MRWNRIFVPFLLLVFLIGVLLPQKALDRHRTPEAALEENLHLPDGEILKIVSLGFTSLISDFLWIKSVLYFGKHTIDDDNLFSGILEKKREKMSVQLSEKSEVYNPNSDPIDTPKEVQTKEKLNFSTDPGLGILRKFEGKGLAPYIYPLLQRVVELNPYFIYPYEFGGLIVLHETGEIDQAYSLLEFGWEHNPNRWEIAYYLGFVDLLYRGNTKKALEWLSQALLLPNHPPFIQQVHQSLVQTDNHKSSVIDYLKGLYYSTENSDTQEQILKMIESIAKSAKTS